MRDKPILTLTPRWRIATDYDLQWILQRRKGSQWFGVCYCTSRRAVERAIREEIGTLGTPEGEIALDVVSTWPEAFADWLKQEREGQIETERAQAA